MASIHLPERAFITLDGEDTDTFLQNLITTDIDGIANGETVPGALLTPQGKIMFDFLISRSSSGFMMETQSENRSPLVQRLTLYKLRAKVTIATPEHDGVTIIQAPDTIPEGGVADRRFALADIALYRVPGQMNGALSDPDAYTRLRIEAGAAEMPADFATQDVFPHDVLFDKNGGVNFRKGCYVGQEVVSRIQHRGTARKRLVRLEMSEPFNSDEGTITAAGKPAGSLGSVSGCHAMAIVRTDRIAAAEGDVTISGMPVSVIPYAWSGVSLEPESAETD